MGKVGLIILLVLIAILFLVVGPYFTFHAFQNVTNGQEFDFWGWLSALWLTFVIGGAAASARK